jgi:YbbR domain-containing protein
VARPAEATVVGTRRDVRRVAEVIADIATEEATPGVGQTAPLLALDADGRVLEGIRIEPAQVVVTLPADATATP